MVIQQANPCGEKKDCRAEKLIGFLIGVFTVIAIIAIIFMGIVVIAEFNRIQLAKDNYCISLGYEEERGGVCFSDGQYNTVDKYANVLQIDTEVKADVKKGSWVYK